jgi:hypothetical protein
MDLSKNELFKPWKDPKSKITSFILHKRVAPVQKTFYFTNPCFSPDGRYCWFQAAWPPAATYTLAMADLYARKLYHYPAAQLGGRPCVDDERKGCYFTYGPAIYFQGARAEKPEKVVEIPPEVIEHRRLGGIASHLVKNADGTRFALSGSLGAQWFVGYADIKRKKTRFLHWFDRCYDHEQYSPTDPHLILFTQDWWRDWKTGKYNKMMNRMWLVRDTGGKPRALIPDEEWGVGNCAHHEWWSPTGKWVYYCDNVYRPNDPINVLRATCVKRVNIKTLKQEVVWDNEVTHAHCDVSEEHFVGDLYSYLWRAKVLAQVRYYNARTGKEIQICSGMPPLENIAQSFPDDPHPCISPKGDFVVYTTTVRGRVDIAVTPMAEILSRI